MSNLIKGNVQFNQRECPIESKGMSNLIKRNVQLNQKECTIVVPEVGALVVVLLEQQRPRLPLVLFRLRLEHEQLAPVLPAQGPVSLVQQAWNNEGIDINLEIWQHCWVVNMVTLKSSERSITDLTDRRTC